MNFDKLKNNSQNEDNNKESDNTDDDKLSFEDELSTDNENEDDDDIREPVEDTTITLSPDQEDAKNEICDFVEDMYEKANSMYNAREKTITVGGYAGTGKTTMISHTANELLDRLYNPNFAFICFTNKACKVLEDKIQESDFSFDSRRDSVSTIHSFLHEIRQIPHGKSCPEATHRIEGGDKDTVFIPKKSLDVDVIFIDEASMIPENLYKQLGRYNVPVVAVGDHGQLPPVDDDFNLMEDPDVRLEKIHRQAEENDIIKFCEEIRNKKELPTNYIGDGDIYNVTHNPTQFFKEENLKNWQFLCFKNRNRVKINNVIRNHLGFKDNTPQAGDKVICVRNNKEALIYNGMIGKIKEIDNYNDYLYEGSIEFDNFTYEGVFLKKQFNNEDTVWLDSSDDENKDIMYSTNAFINQFDFGYCVTVHKFQGSQAKKVCIYHDATKRGLNDWKGEGFYTRWLYTGCSRAEEKLALMGEQ
jgi:exodeoxyribonuclease-5